MLSWLFPNVASFLVGLISILLYKVIEVDLPGRDTQDVLTFYIHHFNYLMACSVISEYAMHLGSTVLSLLWINLPSMLIASTLGGNYLVVRYGSDVICLVVYLAWIIYWMTFIMSLGRILTDFAISISNLVATIALRLANTSVLVVLVLRSTTEGSIVLHVVVHLVVHH